MLVIQKGTHSKGTAGGGAGAQRRPPRGGVVSRGAGGQLGSSAHLVILGPTASFCGPYQHLVTFSLGEDAIHTVEDASQKLALMDSQGRIWAQDMLLRVSPSHVTLLDPVSKVPRGARVEGTAGPSLALGSLTLTSSFRPLTSKGFALRSAYFCRHRCPVTLESPWLRASVYPLPHPCRRSWSPTL